MSVPVDFASLVATQVISMTSVRCHLHQPPHSNSHQWCLRSRAVALHTDGLDIAVDNFSPNHSCCGKSWMRIVRRYEGTWIAISARRTRWSPMRRSTNMELEAWSLKSDHGLVLRNLFWTAGLHLSGQLMSRNAKRSGNQYAGDYSFVTDMSRSISSNKILAVGFHGDLTLNVNLSRGTEVIRKHGCTICLE